MANAGYSSDCKLLNQLIISGKTLPIKDTDSIMMIKIKELMNLTVLEDEITNCDYFGKKYKSHSAWSKETPTLIKINQLRQKYWNFKEIK